MTGSTVRLDKWLWAARFFKTRSLAAHACELGRVKSNRQPVKPAREIKSGDRLEVTNDSGEFQIDVLAVSDMRGRAKIAQTLYRETDASREARIKLAQERKALMHFTPAPQGRPSKRDRRKIIQFRGER
jgi:ribosome-associated heat shock protein Hsp15